MFLGLRSLDSAALMAVVLGGWRPPMAGHTRVAPSKTPRASHASAVARMLAAARRRVHYDMDPGSASTLKKAMRLRRIENGTEGALDPRRRYG